ncbi:MAG: hypothetical protein V3V00_01900 [Saprospiraceae bacterium]
MKREIILLPSLLLASGFECLGTQDIKLLNNYRKHFDMTKFNLEEIFIVTESDYELGGIMNPFNQMSISSTLYNLCKSSIQSFPYVTRLKIKELIYQPSLEDIFMSLKNELFEELAALQQSSNEPIRESISQGFFNIQNLDLLKTFHFYQKTVALHLCGFGEVINDTFNNILNEYLELK